MRYTPINHNLFPARRGIMTDRQEIRARSAELALAFIGVAFDSLMIDTTIEDEAGELNSAFKYVEYFSRKFEAFILTESPDLPEQ
jgi:hypothetical protein